MKKSLKKHIEETVNEGSGEPVIVNSVNTVAYEFEFDIVEYPSTLIETIKVIGHGTNEDTCLRNAADSANEKLKPSQHLRYTQKSLKQITEG